MKATARFPIVSTVAILLAACGGGDSDEAQQIPPPDPPESLALTVDADIKQLRFSWNAVADATHYRLMENPDGHSGFIQIGDDIPADTLTATLGISVHLYDWVDALYFIEACSSTGCTSSGVVTAAEALLDTIGYFKASNTDAQDSFGVSIALSADGDTLAVGARSESSTADGFNGDQADNSAKAAGAVYLFRSDGTDWYQQAYIKASNSDGWDGIGDVAWDMFGDSVALSADGDTLAVGAPEESSSATGIDGEQADNSADAAGAVYLFRFDGTNWYQQAYVKASNTGGRAGDSDDIGDWFGDSVALSADGDTLAVGAPGESGSATGIDGDQADNSADAAGAVYLFRFDGADWYQQAYVKASNTEISLSGDIGGDWFGNSVALSADGDTLAVGSPLEDSSATGINGDQSDNSADAAGAVYLFRFDDTNWYQQAYIKASNSEGWDGISDFFGDNFGASVALSADGDTLAVGAPSERSLAIGINGDQSDNSGGNIGAVYLFRFNGADWHQQAYIKSSNNSGGWLGPYFGDSVALSADGDTLAVGAPGEASDATGIDGDQTDTSVEFAGAVYMFRFDGAGWYQQAYVKASNTDVRPPDLPPDDYSVSDSFGHAVALSDDGDTLAVGAPGEDSGSTGINGDQTDNSARSAGAVYVY